MKTYKILLSNAVTTSIRNPRVWGLTQKAYCHKRITFNELGIIQDVLKKRGYFSVLPLI